MRHLAWLVVIIPVTVLGCSSNPMPGLDVSGRERVGGTGGVRWGEEEAAVLWIWPEKLDDIATIVLGVNGEPRKEVGPCEIEIMDVHGNLFRKIHERVPVAWTLESHRWVFLFNFSHWATQRPLILDERDGSKHDAVTDGLDTGGPCDSSGRMFSCSDGRPRRIRISVGSRYYFEWNPDEPPNVILQ